jgi:ornithine cyclodeaminase/alanine dehydrogenase-like protein (mu-crystallin family)
MSPTVGGALRVSAVFGGARSQIDSRVVILFDAKSGQLLGLIPDDDLNSVRTGAPAGVACRYLAPPHARTVAILGSGVQAHGQLLAIREGLQAVERVRVYSPTLENRMAFAKEMGARLGISVEAVDDPRKAVAGADVIDLATSAGKAVLEGDWVRPGALVISIAPNQVPPELVLRGPLIVSTRERILEEKREPYSSMAAAGEWSYDRMRELGEVILGSFKGRQRAEEVVLCDFPGMPLWDAAIAKVVYEWALERGLGTSFHLSSQ